MKRREVKKLTLLFGSCCLSVIGIVIINKTSEYNCKLTRKLVRENRMTESTELFRTRVSLIDVDGDKYSTYYRDYLNCFSQEDYNLTEIVKEKYILEAKTLPYNIPNVSSVSDVKSWFYPGIDSKIVGKRCKATDEKCVVIPEHLNGDIVNNKVFKGRVRNGFFIESGSLDAGISSVSLIFEIFYNWTGLLVEPIPDSFAEGFKTNRKVYYIQTCLATGPSPHYGYMPLDDFRQVTPDEISMPGLVDNPDGESVLQVQCIPLYTILRGLGNPTVNLWILDIEGSEFAVLKTLPWHLVDIEVIVVELKLAGVLHPGSRQEVIAYLQSKGYTQFDLPGILKPHENDLFVSHKAMIKYQV